MVFGWGKKKEVEKDRTTLPESHQIKLSEVSGIIKPLLEVRTSHILSDIKHIRDNTEPLIEELVMIGKTLEKDDLQVDDVDKHLRIIVVRGKQQVINMIKKDATKIPTINSIDDAENLNFILNQMLKKIGDVLGRQTRVIHIFAKKYAEKLKDILRQLNSNHSELQQLLKNYADIKSLYSEILESLNNVTNIENNITKKKQRIVEIQGTITLLNNEIVLLEEKIKRMKNSTDYEKFLDLKQISNKFNDEERLLKNEINSQFTKISRPLGRYEHVSSLEKEQKKILLELIQDPYEALHPNNKDSIILILENVRKGIFSGSISVKDTEKSFTYITELEESLSTNIKQIKEFIDKKQNIQNKMQELEPKDLFDATENLKNNLLDKEDSELKIKTLENEIIKDHSDIKKTISEMENKLMDFSKSEYTISYTKFN